MAYLGRKGASAPLNSTDIPDGIIIAADIAENAVGTSEIADVITLVTPTFTNIATANGGLQTDTNSVIKDKGRFLQHSTHQSWVMGA